MSDFLDGTAAGRPESRVCVLGDDLVVGVGDPRALGWIGRVSARTSRDEQSIVVLPLGVPGETTGQLVDRWREETGRRYSPGTLARLVLGLGHADLTESVSMARSRLNLANILDEASARTLPTFVVGPPPTLSPHLNEQIGELSDAFADVCQRRRVPFVDTYSPLVNHDDWLTDLTASDGVHPGQVGYGLIAWLVLHGGWHTWLGVPDV